MGYIIAAILLIIGTFFPRTGYWGLCVEAADGLIFVLIAIYVIYTVYQKKRSDKALLVTGVMFGLLMAVVGVRGLVVLGMDIIEGPKTSFIESLEWYQSTGIRGLLTSRQTMTGFNDDDNERITFDISSSDYYRLKGEVTELTVTYYPRTKRILDFKE